MSHRTPKITADTINSDEAYVVFPDEVQLKRVSMANARAKVPLAGQMRYDLVRVPWHVQIALVVSDCTTAL